MRRKTKNTSAIFKLPIPIEMRGSASMNIMLDVKITTNKMPILGRIIVITRSKSAPNPIIVSLGGKDVMSLPKITPTSMLNNK
jgi:hypothetical protein